CDLRFHHARRLPQRLRYSGHARLTVHSVDLIVGIHTHSIYPRGVSSPVAVLKQPVPSSLEASTRRYTMAKKTTQNSRRTTAANATKQSKAIALDSDAPATHDRKAAGVETDIKAANLRRLRRIEGQVRGLQEMVEADRYCVDILVQLAAAQEGLRAVGRELIRNHMKHCVHEAMGQGPAEADEVIDELIQVLRQHHR